MDAMLHRSSADFDQLHHAKWQGEKMVKTATAPWLMRSLMTLMTSFVLSQLVLHSVGNAYAQVITIDKTRFRPSTKEYPSCKLSSTTSFSQQVINFVADKLEVDLVQLGETEYCIHVQDVSTSNTQSLIISGYDFLLIEFSDLLYYGQSVVYIHFHFSFTNHIAIAIKDGKLVLSRR